MSTTCCAAARFDPTLRQGVTWRQGIRLREKATQAPWDLTGYTGRVTVRRQNATGQIVAELTTENFGVLISEPLAGRVEWVLLIALPVGVYAYSANLTAPDGDVIQPLYGQITIEADPNFMPPN
jgi:hypothetical protein